MAGELVVLERQLEPLAPRFQEVLTTGGSPMAPARLIRTCLIAVERNPKLLEANRQSLLNTIMTAAVLGLEMDGVTGQCFPIPFNRMVQLVIGYKGYNTLAARSGLTVTGSVVREGDEFRYKLGTGAFIDHVPRLGSTGRIIASWAVAEALGRPPVVSILDIAAVLAIKAKSPGAKMGDSPWNNPDIGFPAMAEKSAKRRLARSLPLNVMQSAARMEEAFEEEGKHAWISPTKGVIVEGEPARSPGAAELTARVPAGHEHGDRRAGDPAGEPARDAEAAPAAASVSERILAYDEALARAAKFGPNALAAEWAKVPREFQVSLKTGYEKRHLRTAFDADNPPLEGL